MALALHTEALCCQYSVMTNLFLHDQFDFSHLTVCERIEQMVSWYLDIHSRYTDMLGELMADQVACEKQAGAGKRQAFLLSSDEDGEDELGVAQELDQDSDDNAAMVE